jgi:Cu(I)/Ag(I) efflux system membrane fusion protein
VKLGVEADGFLQILHGLSAGEQVVSSGQFLIDSESNLKMAIKSLGGGGEGERPLPAGSTEYREHEHAVPGTQ